MNRIATWAGMTAMASLVWLADVGQASAELEACGGVFLSGDAKCEYREREQCMTECTTVAVEKACVAKLYTSCENECTTTSSTTCESTCSQSCGSQCQTQVTTQQPPNCMGLCVSDCQKTCPDGGRGRRGACCSHNCNERCEDKCANATPTVTRSEECTASCMSACSGSCTAQVNVECQERCQELTYTQCETELVQTCQTKCKDEGGAIFCDGQFVNASNARGCADELKEKLKIEIDVEGSVEAAGDAIGDAVDDTKETGDALCSVRPPSDDDGPGASAALMGLGASALLISRIRRRRASPRDA